MLALLQSSGSSPESRDCWKMNCKTGANSSAAILRAWFCIWSGPMAFAVLMLSSSLRTPSTSIVIGDISGKGLVGNLGSEEGSSSSRVKTFWKWAARVSAFSWSSVTETSFTLSVWIPVLSVRLDLMYLQNSFGCPSSRIEETCCLWALRMARSTCFRTEVNLSQSDLVPLFLARM